MAQHQPIRKTTPPSGSDIPDKLYFRIGEVARLCDIPAYVLRFWESEFPQLKPHKGGTGQRLYRRRDVEMALRIKSLLPLRTAIPRTSGWTRVTVFRSSASSVPARHSVAPPCAATTSPRSFSCAIPSAASAAVNVSLSASPSPASLSLPASNRDESI